MKNSLFITCGIFNSLWKLTALRCYTPPEMKSDNPIRAILFDVGGPIVSEIPEYVQIMEKTRELLSGELGREISRKEFNETHEQAIQSWAPSMIRSILWRFLKPDSGLVNELHRELVGIYAQRESVTLIEDVDEVIRVLSDDYILALAANQPPDIREKLEQTGLMDFFESTVVSGDLGLSKPDSRFFLEICKRIDVRPDECVMIGDRLDNDIYPANVLGMRTIWVRFGPHAVQEPRTPEDVPDAIVEKMIDVLEVINRWKKEGST